MPGGDGGHASWCQRAVGLTPVGCSEQLSGDQCESVRANSSLVEVSRCVQLTSCIVAFRGLSRFQLLWGNLS